MSHHDDSSSMTEGSDVPMLRPQTCELHLKLINKKLASVNTEPDRNKAACQQK